MCSTRRSSVRCGRVLRGEFRSLYHIGRTNYYVLQKTGEGPAELRRAAQGVDDGTQCARVGTPMWEACRTTISLAMRHKPGHAATDEGRPARYGPMLHSLGGTLCELLT